MIRTRANILYGFLFFGNSIYDLCDFILIIRNMRLIDSLKNLAMNHYLVTKALEKAANTVRQGDIGGKCSLRAINEHLNLISTQITERSSFQRFLNK